MKISNIYNLLYEELLKEKIDTKNLIHEDIVKILKGQDKKTFSIKGLAEIISDLEKKAENEIDDEFLSKVINCNCDDIKTLFFKENNISIESDGVEKIRKKRRVTEFEPNKNNVSNPYKEVVITSNILLTLPKDFDKFKFAKKDLIDITEKQENWYDHPIPLDIDDKSNEIIYGLSQLSKSLKYETKETVKVILSVSTTHKSLNNIAKEYIKSKIEKSNIDNLEIYIFTENECNKIVDIISKGNHKLKRVFGVSGKYGRHYSFLKAIVPLFRDVVDKNIKATFKIDLDQVFPQNELFEQFGKYAFESFKSERWGGKGKDPNGKTVRLGMIAGGLVNDFDIYKGLTTPDIKKPNEELNIEQYIFNSSRTQYVSTVAEICNIYNNDNECILRYHITGGMNGILLEYLERFRPFTPSFLTRAEDQAYLLSVFDKEINGEYLRCVHQDKFVMRHDKETFLSEDLKTFEIPKSVGDFERMLIYTHYVNDILGCGDKIKDEINPFTGAFILNRPYLTVLLRMITRLLLLNEHDGKEFLVSFIPRISKLIKDIENGVLRKTYFDEKEAYDLYYDIIKAGLDDKVRKDLQKIFEETKLKY